MWDLKACRSCLATQHKLEKISETLCRLYATVTGLQFKPGDGYPNYFCVECYSHLKKCLAFRRKSRRAFFALQTILNTKKQITIKEIEQVDRKNNNLMSSISNCLPNKYHCFEMTSCTIKDDVPTILISAKDFYNQIQRTSLFSTVTKPIFNVYEPNNIGHVFQIVDIKSDDHPSDQIIPQEVDSQPIIKEETPANDDETNIDLDDVFKDLGEVDNKDDDGWESSENTDLKDDIKDNKNDDIRPQSQIKKKKKSKKKGEKLKKSLNTLKEIRSTVRMLENCILIPQSLDEMKQNFKKRSEQPAYALSQLKCSICIQVFSTVDQIVEHVKFHNVPGAVVSCKVCSIRVTTEEEMLIHEAEEHNYLYNCQVCAKVFYTLNEIKEHAKNNNHIKPSPKLFKIEDLEQYYDIVQTTQKEMYESLQNFDIPNALYKCETCNMKFRDEVACKAHTVLHEEPSPKTHMCDICKIWRNNYSSLELHMINFHKYKYTCKVCSTVMFTKLEACHHKQTHKIPDQCYTCAECHREFREKRQLRIHRELNHYSEHYCHHCIACGQSYTTRHCLYTHQMMQHKRIILPSSYVGEIQFMCLHCQIQFLTDDAYKLHLVKHRHPEANDIPLACITCRMIYDDETEYKKHLQICSKYPKNCVYCDTVINTPVGSASHYRKYHPELAHHRLGTKTSRYTLCEHCGKSVYHSRVLAHMSLHNRELPICSICDRPYPTPVALATHILNKHTVRPYRCALCPAAYGNRRNARDHILKTHAPVTPYRCDWCPLKFSHIDFKNEHITKIHDAKCEKPKTSRNISIFCTYPHMKVDISQITKDLIPKIKFEICDYRDQNTTILQDYTKFFLTDPPPLDLIYTETWPMKRSSNSTKPSKKKKKTNEFGEYEVNEPKLEVDELADANLGNADGEKFETGELGDSKVGDDESGGLKIENLESGDVKFETGELGDLKVGDDESGGLKIEHFESGDVIEEIEIENHAKVETYLELGGQEEIIFDPNMQYEVIEQDGEQYVMVNNLLFKIETE